MATATGAMGLASMAANKTGEASSSKTRPAELNADRTASCSTDGTQVVELVVLNDLNGDISKVSMMLYFLSVSCKYVYCLGHKLCSWNKSLG